MATSQMSGVIQHLRRILRDGAELTDGQLLEDYISRRDDAAFAVLVRRHGPMVWGVCRRVLGNHHDAEDAFQATFIVLVRRAASIASRELLANWLYGVAHQTALKARATAAKRKGRERQVTEMPEPAVTEQDRWPDLQTLLDEELSRLPDKYRGIIVLCELEGKTRKEAARQLGVPDGTVASRLVRARIMLAKRLTRRGVVLAGGALAALLVQQAVSAGVPSSVVDATINAASLLAAGKAATTGAVSLKVAALTEGVMKAMLLTKLKAALAVVLLLGVIATGATIFTCRTAAAQAQEQKDSSKTLPAKEGGKPPDQELNQGNQPAQQSGDREPPPLEDPKVVEAIKAEGGEVSFDGMRRWTMVHFAEDKGSDASLIHLKGLKHLRTLNLLCGPAAAGFRQLSDAGLAHLKDIKTIRTVNFAQVAISDAGLAHLKGWKDLEKLNLIDVPIAGTGLEHLQGLPLKLLWISTGPAVSRHFSDAGLAHVKGFAKLQDLSLHSPAITDAGLEHLKGMVHLRSLTLGTGGLSEAGGISDAGLLHLRPLAKGKLESLELLCPRVTDAGLEHLKAMTKLKNLNLSEAAVTDDGLLKLKRLTKLTGLNLSATRVTDAGLGHLKFLSGSLEWLDLRKTSITDDGLEQLSGFRKLRTLNLTETSVTDAGVERLQRALPEVRVQR